MLTQENQQYGDWTTIKFLGQDKWLCRCKCGYEQNNSARAMRIGRTTRCETCNVKVYNESFIGKKFGKLTIIKYLGKKGERAYFECLCECGVTIEKRGHKVYGGQFDACNSCRQAAHHHPMQHLYTRMVLGAKTRNISVTITKEDLWNLLVKQDFKCALTKLPLTYKQSERGGIKQRPTASIDRINSLGGYTLNNIQWVHKDINNMKQDYTQKEFIDYCKLIALNN